MVSELITTQHLAKKAIVYIRQSTVNQVLTNQESLELQYALKQKAIEFGWREDTVQLIDADLGLTGSTAEHRTGFKDILAQVACGHIGIILSFDVTRLSRNCSDWYPLLDLCGYKQCLIADRDGVYDPSTINGRLLLGLKGQLAEVELSTIRARMNAGLLNKAKRGELGLSLPIGLIRTYDIVQKDPNMEIQKIVGLIFEKFIELKSLTKILIYFNDHDIHIPRYNKYQEVYWVKPSKAAFSYILKNPAYAGAFSYGRTRVIRSGPSLTNMSIKTLPQEEWKILIKDKYPAYINWETFDKIQSILRENYAEYERNKTRGIPREGSVLLQGLVFCGECGHKMCVQYKGANRYLCNCQRQNIGGSVCQNIKADAIDKEVVALFFQAISPIELDAYTHAVTMEVENDKAMETLERQQLERLRYQAKLADRQYNRVDPDNRIIAAELERRWEQALRELQHAEEKFNAKTQKIATASDDKIPEKLKQAFLDIGKNLPDIWDKSVLSRKQKKSFLRCLIDKVVIHRSQPDTITTRIVWVGGDTTTLHIRVSVGAVRDLSNVDELKKAIIELAKEGKNDQEISEHLTSCGYRSPMRLDVLLTSTIRNVRLQNGILASKEGRSYPRRVEGYLTISQTAIRFNVTLHWIYDRIYNKQIAIEPVKIGHYKNSMYVFPDTEETVKMFESLKEQYGKTLNLKK